MEEALGQREQYQRDALPIAGGQSLLVLLRNKLIDPKVLIDLEKIGELRDVQRRTDRTSIGAMNTIYNLMSSSEVRAAAPILSQAASKVGSTAIRNLGTIGGNLCHNEPGADLPPALLALNATVELRSLKGTRKVPLRILSRLFRDRRHPDELLCSVKFRCCPPRHPVSTTPSAKSLPSPVWRLCLSGMRKSGQAKVRIGLGGVAPVPFRASKAESAVRGAAVTDAAMREAAEIASSEADPMTDPHGSADYRRKMVKVMVRRAISAAIEQSERNGNGKA
jgi:carbon-monoxide dehydrogenase medium subunit